MHDDACSLLLHRTIIYKISYKILIHTKWNIEANTLHGIRELFPIHRGCKHCPLACLNSCHQQHQAFIGGFSRAAWVDPSDRFCSLILWVEDIFWNCNKGWMHWSVLISHIYSFFYNVLKYYLIYLYYCLTTTGAIWQIDISGVWSKIMFVLCTFSAFVNDAAPQWLISI